MTHTGMMGCRGCIAAVNNGVGSERCANGFVQGGYPDGRPNCMKEDGPGNAYWLFPNDQWDAIRMVDNNALRGGRE